MKNYITTGSDPEYSEPEGSGSESKSPGRVMLNVPSGQVLQVGASNISHNSSFQKLIRATPSFINSTSGRKHSVEAVPSHRNKAAIYQML